MHLVNPSDIAREALKRLATERLPPTPDNFSRFYAEYSGQEGIVVETRPDPAKEVSQALPILASDFPGAEVSLDRIQQALAAADWPRMLNLVQEHVRVATLHEHVGVHWDQLVKHLLQQWEGHQPGLTITKKRQALERVLANHGRDPAVLYRKLNKLIDSWGQPLQHSNSSLSELGSLVEDLGGDLEEALSPHAQQNAPAKKTIAELFDPALWSSWRDLLFRAISHGVIPRLAGFPELAEELEQLAHTLNSVDDGEDLEMFSRRLKKLWIKIELHLQHEERIVGGLTNLLNLLLENLDELAGSDRHISGQITVVREVLSHEPVTMRAIYQLEAGLKEVIYKQGLLKHSLDQATDSLRGMLNTFTSRLSMMVEHTDDYQAKIHDYSEQLASTHDLIALGDIVNNLVTDTRSIQFDLVSTRDELMATRSQVESAESRIQELEAALDSASAKIKEDQLTGVYNRRGLDEIFSRELARSAQTGRPLSLALIDIDNFKKLNDTFGHLTGDDALRHLVDVMVSKLKPTDIVARFGGEEFVILLPETPLDEAVEVIRRLQRELTKAYFMANKERMVLTFSAGVTSCLPGEEEVDIIDRADRAMYHAKINGKNRAVSAEELEHDNPEDLSF